MDLVVIRILERNTIRITRADNVPSDAIATGRVVDHKKEYLVGDAKAIEQFMKAITP